MSIAHWPTWILLVGYPLFWLELYCLSAHKPQTTPLAWVLFAMAVGVMLWRSCRSWQRYWMEGRRQWRQSSLFFKITCSIWLALGGLYLATVFYAYCLPPHLVQESDALNYHLTIPRQHLLAGSFAHLSWSVADLFLLPVDFSLAPFCLATPWPNKLVQMFFLWGILAVSVRLFKHLQIKDQSAAWVLLAVILSAHHIGIQAGTAMLDLAVAYLFLAGLDSFLDGAYAWAGIEWAFYVWSKPLLPLQSLLVVLIMMAVLGTARRCGYRFSLGFSGQYTQKIDYLKLGIVFVAASLVIAGPFMAKSVWYAGSLLFPLGVGAIHFNPALDMNAPVWKSIQESAAKTLAIGDQYGSGRGLGEFLKHWWLIAVPEHGVNNRYDYPVGLMYLLCIGPFFVFLWRSFRQKILPVLPVLILVFWGLWWLSCQQTRFLMVPLVLIYITVVAAIDRRSKVFLTAVTLALALTTLSVVHAHERDWGRSRYEVLRRKDKRLLAMASHVPPGQTVDLDFPDAAFATFRIHVTHGNPVFVLGENCNHKCDKINKKAP